MAGFSHSPVGPLPDCHPLSRALPSEEAHGGAGHLRKARCAAGVSGSLTPRGHRLTEEVSGSLPYTLSNKALWTHPDFCSSSAPSFRAILVSEPFKIHTPFRKKCTSNGFKFIC